MNETFISVLDNENITSAADITGEPVTNQAPTEDLVYTIGIPNQGRDFTSLVHIDEAVLEHFRYAEIERMVTGTNHVTVCAPEHFTGTIDEEVFVTLDDNGEVVIYNILTEENYHGKH